jgi:glycosyltransferase involved in cell wall biosynthesis
VDARSTSVLFLAPEPVQTPTNGASVRVLSLAEAVAEHCRVTVAAPSPSTFPEGPFDTLETGPVDDQRLARVLAGHDVVVTQTLPTPRQLATARRHSARLVVDILAPLALEAAETGPPEQARAVARWRSRQMLAHLVAADLVLCGNERQRDLIAGVALAAGAMAWGGAEADAWPRIEVAPPGIDADPPGPTGTPLRASGAVSEGDRVVLWVGGLWSWFDPVTAVKAVERLRGRRPDLKLVFAGFEYPDPSPRFDHARPARETVEYVRRRDLAGHVVFRPEWLGLEDYMNALLEADVGISLHRPGPEAHFAARKRLLDYLRSGLPVACTEGDQIGDLVRAHGLGEVVAPLDVDACAAALDRLTSGERERVDASDALVPFHWRNVARPLVEYCVRPDPVRRPSRRALAALSAQQYPTFLTAVHRMGREPLARAAGRRLTRALRRA